MKKIKILNITHGDNPYCAKKDFLPIAAGACREDIINDASGKDNISKKNKYYGDFTSIYWAWKNLKGVDYIGTSHYRRYISDVLYLPNEQYNIKWEDFCKYKYKSGVFIKKLKKYDFIMIKPKKLDQTIEEQYLSCHPYPEILKIVDDILLNNSPDYLDIWKFYLKSTTLQFGFLFITNWDNFDKLCSWLFPILSELENKIDVEKFEGYQSRVIAFIYERLVPVYILKNKLNVLNLPLFYISETEGKSPHEYIKSYWYLCYHRKIRKPIVNFFKQLIMKK